MISVEQAFAHVIALATAPQIEDVTLAQADGRVLLVPIAAARTQPPFPASAMDGYAICAMDAHPDAILTVIGEAAAGHSFGGTVSAGQAVRIFTGAPVPKGADRVVIQEDVARDGDTITLKRGMDDAHHIRPAGIDFSAGDILDAPRRITPRDVALMAAMNHATVPVARRPVVAVMATGDELVPPGGAPGPDQIIASNSYGIAAQLRRAGAEVRILPIARDSEASLIACFDLAHGADLIVTIGGASVGDHDLVGQVAAARGLDRSFYKIAMRPGKPLMAGHIDGVPMVGLPGNPVSSMVCAQVFLVPLVCAMQGLPARMTPPMPMPLTASINANGPRTHYMRAVTDGGRVTVLERQDSSLLRLFAEANALVIRAPNAPAADSETLVDVIPL